MRPTKLSDLPQAVQCHPDCLRRSATNAQASRSRIQNFGVIKACVYAAINVDGDVSTASLLRSNAQGAIR